MGSGIDMAFRLVQTGLTQDAAAHMTTEIGAFVAKTQLPKLLERVEKGERFVITRHGRPVAELTPIVARDIAGIRQAVAELRRIRSAFARRKVKLQDVLLKGESIRDLTHADHRY